VFLDRDGTLNAMVYDADHGTVDSPARPDQFRLLPGVGAAVRAINDLGFLAIVISNQPGVAKGKLSRPLLDKITDTMHADLASHGARLAGVYYCLHHPEGTVAEYRAACECRKPAPGLLLRAAEEHDVDLGRSYMVGDGLTDVGAARAAGCRGVWLGPWQCHLCRIGGPSAPHPDVVARDLEAAVALIGKEAGC
jgi:D-glycero-D-manno-heptose 1,7-bisphosphate phosphatase